MFLTFYPSADAGISDPRSLATFRRKIRVFGRMAYGGGKGKSPPGGAWRAGAAKIAGWRL
jgi:hypothetical protein